MRGYRLVVARTLYFCGATLIIDSALVTLLSICIDGSFDVFAEDNSNLE